MAQEKDSGFSPSLKKTITWSDLSTTRHFYVLLNTLLELRKLYSKNARRVQWMKLWILQFLLLCLQQSVQLLNAARMTLKASLDEEMQLKELMAGKHLWKEMQLLNAESKKRQKILRNAVNLPCKLPIGRCCLMINVTS
jgi:hypothetical protein